MGTTMQPLNTIIQSTSVDLLQGIIARGEIDDISVESIEAAVIGKLYFCVHMSRLDLQNKLLHLLHSLISVSTAVHDVQPRQSDTVRKQGETSIEGVTQESPPSTTAKLYDINPLLVQTLVDGIATPTNRPVLQHWLDFILMAVPQFQPALQAAIVPLNDSLCRQMRLALSDVLQASAKAHGSTKDISSLTTDSDLIMFLNGLERLILLSLANPSEASPTEEDTPLADKSGQENSGLLGYVSNVFSSDNVPSTTEEQLTVRFHERIIFDI
jgi:hypothetical protein